MKTRWLLVVAFLAASLSLADAQQLLDRVVARVGGTAITQSDVDAAVALGVVQAPSATAPAAISQLVDRHLLLAEVARFPPPEPSGEAVAALSAKMKAHAGAGYDAVLRRTGVDDQRIRDLARDTLRIEAYVDQRFGTSQTPERRREMLTQWIEDLRMRGDVVEIASRP